MALSDPLAAHSHTAHINLLGGSTVISIRQAISPNRYQESAHSVSIWLLSRGTTFRF